MVVHFCRTSGVVLYRIPREHITEETVQVMVSHCFNHHRCKEVVVVDRAGRETIVPFEVLHRARAEGNSHMNRERSMEWSI